MGEHKDSGISVMCELLAGALTGTGTAGPCRVRQQLQITRSHDAVGSMPSGVSCHSDGVATPSSMSR